MDHAPIVQDRRTCAVRKDEPVAFERNPVLTPVQTREPGLAFHARFKIGMKHEFQCPRGGGPGQRVPRLQGMPGWIDIDHDVMVQHGCRNGDGRYDKQGHDQAAETQQTPFVEYD